MKRKNLLLLSALFAFFCGQAPAQSVPALINYQGQLTDANGTNLPTADYALTFRIYDAATGGNLVWGPQVFDGATGTTGHGPKIPVVQGYFNVLLGSNDTAGASLAEAFNGAARYVEIKVGANSPITPRQQTLTAPFAFKANGAERLTMPGANAAAVAVGANGNVGIGTSTPQAHVPSRRALIIAAPPAPASDGALVELWGESEGKSLLQSHGGNTYVGNLARGQGNGDTYIVSGNGDPALSVSGLNGNVGIGKPDPQVALDVLGSVSYSGLLGKLDTLRIPLR